MPQEFFIQRPQVTPTIYAYEFVDVESHKNYIKVGFTDRTAEERIKEQLHVGAIPYRILLKESAMRTLRRRRLSKTDEKYSCSIPRK